MWVVKPLGLAGLLEQLPGLSLDVAGQRDPEGKPGCLPPVKREPREGGGGVVLSA